MVFDLDFHTVVVRAETFEGCTVELFLMVRMGDADEEFRTLLHRLAVKIHRTELCHDMVNV